MLLLLNVANPDGLIARANLHRVTQGKDLDCEYLQKLSTDAVPVILKYEAHLSTDDEDTLLENIFVNRLTDVTGWRSWNASRARARRQLGDRAEYRWLLED